jgi:acylglycerol lipase
MQRATFTYTNSRRHELHCVEYAPPPGVKPRAALFLHHGIAEHIERYAPGALRAKAVDGRVEAPDRLQSRVCVAIAVSELMSCATNSGPPARVLHLHASKRARAPRLSLALLLTSRSRAPSADPSHDAAQKNITRKVFSHWASDHALAVYGYDCHGHGRSGPHGAHERVYVHRFGDLVDDFVDFVGHVTEERLPRVAAGQGAGSAAAAPPPPPPSSPPPPADAPPPLPRVLGGHSLGGLVAAHAVLRLAGPAGTAATPQSTGVAGLVLHSAALDVVWTPVLRALAGVGALLSALLPRARLVPAVKPEDMHPDPAVVREYLEDPHVIVGNTRARTANEVLRGFRGLAGKEGLFDLPILAVHGAADATTSLEAVRRFCAGAASAARGLVRLREVEGGYHELMAAPGEREREAEEVAAWIEGLPEVLKAGGGALAAAAGAQQQQQQQQATATATATPPSRL